MLWEIRMAIRLVFVAVAGIVGIPFAVSSPGKAAFWVVMGTVAAVMLPGLAVTTYFLTDSHRLRREHEQQSRDVANPS